ncbi:MAG: hypothetical protein EU547_02300 [Promethearchaeota archaeon]|nr:MAG: hypothetical protein EU547_02300 [Candidatus Lokiarchaeota archaeon]
MNDNQTSKVDCYDIILNYFENSKDSPSQQEIWKNKVYLKLIEMLKEGKHDKDYIRNLFILVLNLFGENIPPDLYTNRGQQLEKVNNKKEIKKILREEFS